MSTQKYTDVIVTISNGVGTIKFNRPSSLNAFGGSLMLDTVAALRELNDHPDTVFTVITGEGRFVSFFRLLTTPCLDTSIPNELS
jgi:Delta3-Delta2-enoyl-CoA isomerase